MDDIVTITTQFPDVASLAQGYVDRADGERLLLPFAEASANGSGVRFVVLLADGTPAFAGAGLCVQVSDQGETVPADQRFETLLDTLQFDERSQPVYDYIVAVRSAHYAPPTDVEIDADAESAADAEPTTVAAAETDAQASEVAVEVAAPSPVPSYEEAEEPQAQVLWSAEEAQLDPVEEAAPVTSWMPSETLLRSEQPPIAGIGIDQPSFIPPPVPTGLLLRPARVAHWQPAPPRRPTPRPETGLFRYPRGSLPAPPHPPRPELDPILRVRPAPKP